MDFSGISSAPRTRASTARSAPACSLFPIIVLGFLRSQGNCPAELGAAEPLDARPEADTLQHLAVYRWQALDSRDQSQRHLIPGGCQRDHADARSFACDRYFFPG